MKKIYSFVFAAIAILSAASCQKENITENAVNAGPFSFTATREVESKTVLVDGKSVEWTVGDNVSAFDAEGNAVSFAGTHTEQTASALFYTPSYSIPANYTIHAIYPDRSGVSTLNAEGVINNLRIAGTQTAVAGSFDPNYGVAYAKGVITDLTTPPTLQFTNIHTLFKFTIGGETAPETVVLTNGGMRSIAGLFTYNTKDGKISQGEGAKEITLKPAAGQAFEVGKTYYISAIGGGNFANVTLSFDGTVVKTVEGAKYADETNNFFLNQIINLGTVEFPTVEETPVEKIEATPVRVLQSTSASYMATFGSVANRDRNVAIDGEYIYIAETQGSPVLWKISIADGTASTIPVGTVNGGGTFALSCPRIIPNSDPTINGGKDVLVVSNMGMDGGNAFLYVYKDGIDSDPVKLSLNTGWMSRRIGDKFTYVSGANGLTTILMKDGNSGALLTFNLTMKDGSVTCTEATSRTYLVGNWDNNGVGGFYVYPGLTNLSEGIYATTEKGCYVVKDANVLTADNKATYVTSWDNKTEFAGCHGFNFFKHNDKDYIAYTSFAKKTLYIIEGAATANDVNSALKAKRVVFEASIASAENTQGSGNSGADCSVYQKNGETYVAGHIQNVGVVVYKLN